MSDSSRQAWPPESENVLKELSGIGGKILTTSVSQEDEAKLQAALKAARS